KDVAGLEAQGQVRVPQPEALLQDQVDHGARFLQVVRLNHHDVARGRVEPADAPCLDAFARVADHHDRLAAGVPVLDSELDVGRVFGRCLLAAADLDLVRGCLRAYAAGEGLVYVALVHGHIGGRPGVVGGQEEAAVAGPADGGVEVLAVAQLQAHPRRGRGVDE